MITAATRPQNPRNHPNVKTSLTHLNSKKSLESAAKEEPRKGLSSFSGFVKRISNLRAVVVDQARDLRRGLGLYARDHVGVLLESERRRLVPEALVDHLDRDAGLGRACSALAEILEADLAQAGFVDQALKRLAECVRVDGLAVLLGHDEILVLVAIAPLAPLVVLPLRWSRPSIASGPSWSSRSAI